MAIAVSAVVTPSRLLTRLTLTMCAGSLVIGVLIGAGTVGMLAPLPRVLLAVACIALAIQAGWSIRRDGAPRRIDISRAGRIRVTAGTVTGAMARATTGKTIATLPAATNGAAPAALCCHAPAELFELLPSSTIWSFLLVLNLRSRQGKAVTLIVLPDTMPQTSFRALSVACHWIAAHNIRAADENS